mgnify:CR=1 FL=1
MLHFVDIFASSSCLLILSPFYINGWDEQIHYTTAYELGVTKEGELQHELKTICMLMLRKLIM